MDSGSAPLVGGGGLALSVLLAFAGAYRLRRFLRSYEWRLREAAWSVMKACRSNGSIATGKARD